MTMLLKEFFSFFLSLSLSLSHSLTLASFLFSLSHAISSCTHCTIMYRCLTRAPSYNKEPRTIFICRHSAIKLATQSATNRQESNIANIILRVRSENTRSPRQTRHKAHTRYNPNERRRCRHCRIFMACPSYTQHRERTEY